MAQLDKLTVAWSGFIGAPGYTVFYATPGNGVRAYIESYFSWFRQRLPSTVTITIPNTGETFEDSTGDQNGTWVYGSTSVLQGADVGPYTAASGVCTNWGTNVFIAGRRVRGRTFIVPIGGASYEANGTISTIALTDFRDAAQGLVTSANGALKVWHRPTTKGGTDGIGCGITSTATADKAAVLTSRRQ